MIRLNLHLQTISQIACISQSRNNESFRSKLIINGSAPYLHARFASVNIFYAYGTGNGHNNINSFGVPFFS